MQLETSAQNRRPEHKRRWTIKLVKLGLGMICAIVLLEVGLRVLDPFDFSESRRRDALAAKIMGSGKRWRSLKPGGRAEYLGHEILIGSHGMRNPPTPLKKPEGTYRILVLGDSVAFGWGVAEKDCFPRVLERQLREDPPPLGFASIEVINAAVPGRNLVDNFFFLVGRGMSYEPDLILLTLINDDVPLLDETGKQLTKASGVLLPAWTRALDMGLLLQQQLDKIYKVKKTQPYAAVDGLPKGGLIHVCELFKRFKEFCKDVPIVIIDTFGKRGKPGFSGIIACCREHGLPRIVSFLWSETYRQEYAVSDIDDHPNAQGHFDMAKPVVRWCRKHLPK